MQRVLIKFSPVELHENSLIQKEIKPGFKTY